MPRVTTVSVFVDDQEAALSFYTDVLGFDTAADIPVGEHRWLTVVSPEDPSGPQVVLEPADHPAVGPFTQALYEDGLPAVSFGVADVQAEYERLSALGVRFVQEPLSMGPVTTAVLDDTCGNLVQIASTNDTVDDDLDDA